MPYVGSMHGSPSNLGAILNIMEAARKVGLRSGQHVVLVHTILIFSQVLGSKNDTYLLFRRTTSRGPYRIDKACNNSHAFMFSICLLRVCCLCLCCCCCCCLLLPLLARSDGSLSGTRCPQMLWKTCNRARSSNPTGFLISSRLTQ